MLPAQFAGSGFLAAGGSDYRTWYNNRYLEPGETSILQSGDVVGLNTDGDADTQEITFRVEEDLLGSCGFGLIFVLGALSFHDGRPRGVSGEWFEDADQARAAATLVQAAFAAAGFDSDAWVSPLDAPGARLC